MDSCFAYATTGFCLILILLFLYYWNEYKKVQDFPFYNIVLKYVYDQITGKIPKDVAFNSYAFNALVDGCKQYAKDGFCMMYFVRPILLIFSEEAMKFFLNEKAALDKPPEYAVAEEMFGTGLITSNGEKWRTRRKLMNPIFHLGVLKDLVPLFNEHAAALIKDMEKLVGNSSVDLLDALKCNYFNSLSESVFGLKQYERSKGENLKSISLVDSLSAMVVRKVFNPWLRLNFLLMFSFSGRKFLRDKKEYHKFISKIINEMKQQVGSNKSVDTDRFSNHLQKSFTYILLNQHLNDPSFTFQNLHDEVSTIFIAGYDAVTYTTLWCLFMLALHPEVQEKAFNEIESVTDNYITYEDSCNLTYLEAVIMETLRIYPTVPIIGRTLSEDVQFGNYKVYKGTSIIPVSYMSHRNPDIYPNPEHFEPERFLNAEAKRAWSYIPFSEGRRTCIGKKYALIEMKIFLSYILRNFKITSFDKREDINVCWTISLTPARPIRMKVTPRHADETYCKKDGKVQVCMN